LLRTYLEQWPNEINKPFKDNSLAIFIREAFAKTVERIVFKNNSELKIKASAGAGNWANIPWLSIIDERITNSTQNGIYPVFVFRADGSGVYLSLNQGTTEPKNKLGKKGAEKQATKVKEYLHEKIHSLQKFDQGKLELKATTELGKSYEFPNIGAFLYRRDNLPSNEQLEKNLLQLLNIYDQTANLWPNILNLYSDNNKVNKDVSLYQETSSIEFFNIDFFKSSLQTANLILQKTLPYRFVSSLQTKPFMILTGLSGSGKTKLAEAFSLWISESNNQYCMVSVGADWTNREPILGYPNALEPGKYVKPDNGVLDLILSAELDPDKPYFLILDEMNMSHVERYFADFLSAMESTDRTITLHPEGEEWENCDVPASLILPENLFIIGTVNIDETTYMFSPKVLDRANVIEFRVSDTEMESFFESPENLDLNVLRGAGASMANDFIKTALQVVEPTNDLKDKLMPFFNSLKKAGAEFGYRTAFEMSRFITICNNLSDNTMNADEIIDAAIIQKLLPKVHGSRNKIEPILKDLAKLCLEADEEPFQKDENGNDSFPVKYPLSYEKLERMYHRVISDGFTSFAEA